MSVCVDSETGRPRALIPLVGHELSRGRGGPRRLTMSLSGEALEPA